MSTLKLENIQHPESSTPAISLDSSGAMSGSFPYPNRNLIYNGAMQVHQRGTSVTGITGTGNGYYTADRWRFVNTAGTWTNTVENDAPTGSGFVKSYKLLCTTADASLAASDQIRFAQSLEGQDLQNIAKGTSAAKTLTMSFWVKSNVTGTYVAEIFESDNTRQVSASYSVETADTWERKSFTFPADTAGVLDNDNEGSFVISWFLGVGSDRSSGTLNTSWQANVNADRAVGQTNLAASVNNYWQITGVQLETGSVATEFEHEPYGVTLAKCQRYYKIHDGTIWATSAGTTSPASICQWIIQHNPFMRTSPTVTIGTATYCNFTATTSQREDLWRAYGTPTSTGSTARLSFVSFDAEL